MTSSSRTILPPDEKRCQHYHSDGSRCPNWAMADSAFCPNHDPEKPTPPTGPTPQKTLDSMLMNDLVDHVFLIQSRLASFILAKTESNSVDILELSELSK